MNNEHFFDLAMKVIARQAGDAERTELEALLAGNAELRAEYARLEADVRAAKEVLPILGAMEGGGGALPSYARGRLQTKVRQTLGRPPTKEGQDRSMVWGWRWMLGLAATTALVVLVAMPFFRAPGGPVIQVAMLDTAGTVRGANDHDTEVLRQQWKNSTFQNFENTVPMENWLTNWPAGNQPVVKVIYNRAAGVVRVLVQGAGQALEKDFPVDADLATTLLAVENYVREQSKK